MGADLNARKNTNGPLLTEDEAIAVLGLHARRNPRGSLRWLMRTKKLDYVRLAKGIYGYQREDLAACIQRCRVSHEK